MVPLKTPPLPYSIGVCVCEIFFNKIYITLPVFPSIPPQLKILVSTLCKKQTQASGINGFIFDIKKHPLPFFSGNAVYLIQTPILEEKVCFMCLDRIIFGIGCLCWVLDYHFILQKGVYKQQYFVLWLFRVNTLCYNILCIFVEIK